MVLFILHEARNYCVEGGSPLHVCYLDARAAFDCVWISCLLYKLHDKGIGGKDLRKVYTIRDGY